MLDIVLTLMLIQVSYWSCHISLPKIRWSKNVMSQRRIYVRKIPHVYTLSLKWP